VETGFGLLELEPLCFIHHKAESVEQGMHVASRHGSQLSRNARVDSRPSLWEDGNGGTCGNSVHKRCALFAGATQQSLGNSHPRFCCVSSVWLKYNLSGHTAGQGEPSIPKRYDAPPLDPRRGVFLCPEAWVIELVRSRLGQGSIGS